MQSGESTVEELRRHAADLRHYADGIEAALATATDVGAALAAAWADATGREWADRLHLVRRELGRQVDAAHEMAHAADRTVADLVGDLLRSRSGPSSGGRAAVGRAPYGVRLGGLDGSRVGSGRGVVVPTLPDPGG